MSEENDLEKAEPQIIKTQDENGEIHNFELVDIIKHNDKEYGLLVHLPSEEGECSCGHDHDEEEDDEEEVVIMRLSKEDDSYTFETIEDDEEFNEVVALLEEEGELEEVEDDE